MEVEFMDASVLSTTQSTPPPPSPAEPVEEGPMTKSLPPDAPKNTWVANVADSAIVYPPVGTYDFQLAPMKRVDRNLSVYYAGVKDPISKKRWAFTIGTPTCYVQFATSAFEGEAPNSRALLCPLYFDHTHALPDHSPFMAFLDHVEAISNRLKSMLATQRDVSTWQSPLKLENGFIVGVQAKIRTDTVRQAILQSNGTLKCCLRMTCVYFAKERSGISFELIEAYSP